MTRRTFSFVGLARDRASSHSSIWSGSMSSANFSPQRSVSANSRSSRCSTPSCGACAGGSRTGAPTHYSTITTELAEPLKSFLFIWKDADPDVPVFPAAKVEYAKLR
jgi:hypothetical protein